MSRPSCPRTSWPRSPARPTSRRTRPPAPCRSCCRAWSTSCRPKASCPTPTACRACWAPSPGNSAGNGEPQHLTLCQMLGYRRVMVDETLLVGQGDGVLSITLNRPEAANALTPDQRDRIIDLLAGASEQVEVRAVVLGA